MGVPLLNDQLVLSKRDMELLERPSLRPDLYFPRFRLVIEHYGARWHEGVSRMVEDVMRIQCYSALGIRVFPTTARDLATADAYESFLRKLAYGIGVDHGLALRDRFVFDRTGFSSSYCVVFRAAKTESRTVTPVSFRNALLDYRWHG